MARAANEIPDAPRVVPAERWRELGTLAAARALLGKFLVRTTPAGRTERMITEVEAYDGERDLACHARRGRTPRTEVMYQAGGCWYVYFVYGRHEMLNLVVGPPGWPAAVLIRGVDGVAGPGRLTRAFGVDRSLNGARAEPASGLHLEDRGVVVGPRRVLRTPRIGVEYAGPVWAAKRWRFVLEPAPSPVRAGR